MNAPTRERLTWTQDFIVIDGKTPTQDALRQIEESTARWIIISRDDGIFFYALTRDELWKWPRLLAARKRASPRFMRIFERALDLHEEFASTQTENRDSPPAIEIKSRPHAKVPSIFRYVEVGTNHEPIAIGGVDVVRVASRRSARAKPPTRDVPATDDEGTTPVRHPSIESDSPLLPEGDVTLTVDLLRTAAAHTQGAVALGEQAPNWERLELTVALSCPCIDFEGEGRGTITIHRNADSEPARIRGRVRADAANGNSSGVVAAFFDRTRYCGSAFRNFPIGPTPASSGTPPAPPTAGIVAAEPAAQLPDMTVHISTVSKGAGRLDWLVHTKRFDGLPARLRGQTDLGQDTAADATALFKEFATLERGQHQKPLEGFGTRLWQRAPVEFREIYWALWDHYARPLSIQFISDEPHLPWELMRPARADDSEIHPPLALKHSVARWIARWDGFMRNQLPAGRICTIAPKYEVASRRLPRALAEAAALEKEFGAERVEGTRGAVTALLENAPSPAVAVLHFAGHGKFASSAATQSNIKLEDGTFAASEVERPEVKLGKAFRTLVFFNACEVGVAANVFGDVGGWADAFLGRQFGGFIAPLWSIDDEDAGTVAAELLEGVVRRHQPIGEVLRDIRAKHGNVSPTFYSYLYYGDVTARLGA